MRKAINLHAQLHAGATRSLVDSTEQNLAGAFAAANPGMTLTIRSLSEPDATGNVTVQAYIEGDQDPAADFEALAQSALDKAIQSMPATRDIGAEPVSVRNLEEVEHEDENEDVVLPPLDTGVSERGLGVTPKRATTRRRPKPLPVPAHKPQVPATTFNGCPSGGDGGDPDLNTRKNRTDEGKWSLAAVGDLVGLHWPPSVGRLKRAQWSAADTTEVARHEGTPLQVEGWLAGAKAEGPESCNCHSVADVDYHLWIVGDQSQVHDRSQSLVCEVTPRVRANHSRWDFLHIKPLVDGKTKVRLSGWLLMDQEHPDQVGNTRGTTWEIHPVINFEVQRDSGWFTLDEDPVASRSLDADAGSQEAPGMPPEMILPPAADSSSA